MNLTELIEKIQEKGLISVSPLCFAGKARATFDMLVVVLGTDPMENDADWWALRLYLVRN